METRNHDYVVAWTDGASVCNQDSRFRRAGCGVFFGINDNRNCSFTLPGREQTNNRAELLAVITAMKIYDGNLEIRSDSDHVVRTANCRMRGEIPAAAHHSAPKVLTDAALVRQRTALATHCFASELLFRKRVALLALHEADHG